MLSQNVTRDFWRYTLPAVAALVVSGLYQIIDGMFIGRSMGAEGLSAINMAWPLSGMLFAVGMMIGMGCGAVCSIAQGARKYERARQALAQGLLLIVVLGVVLGAVVVWLAPAFMRMQGAEGRIAQLGVDFLRVVGMAGPLVLASIALPLLVRNLGAPRLATLAMITGCIVNVALGYLFIIELNGGLKGAALATVIGESASMLICLTYVFSRRNRLRPQTQDAAPQPRLCGEVLSTGVSSMLMYLYISLVVVLHNLLFMKYGGPLEVAAYGITGYLLAFYYMLAEGICGGMQPLVSYYHGARQPRNVRKVLRLGLMSGVGFGVVFVVLLMLMPWLFAGIFTAGDEALMAVTVQGIRLHLFVLFLDGFIILAATFFQAMGRARNATLITLSNMLILFPFLGVLPLLLGLNGIWLSLPISNICLALLVGVMLFRQVRRMSAPQGA